MNGRPPVLGRAEADELLRRRTAEHDALGAGLLELEHSPGRLLLDGAALAGRTADAWRSHQAAVATLWAHFTAYGQVLERARVVRARRARPQRADLEELTALLLGPAAELTGPVVPIGARALADPAGGVRFVDLDTLVAGMEPAWAVATAVVSAADEVWTRLLPVVDRLETRIRDTAAAIGALGGPSAVPREAAELDVLRRRLGTARDLLATDPLPLATVGTWAPEGGRPAGDRHIGPVDITELEDGIRALADAVGHLTDIQQRFDERVRRLRERLDDLEYEEGDALRRRAHVLSRISGRPLPEVPSRAATLGRRLSAVAASREDGDWSRLGDDFGVLERDVERAHERLTAIRGHIDVPLARRDELRGLVQAYRAMATARGGATEAEESLYRHARRLLWQAPCELDVAVRVVRRYQQTVIDGGEDGAAADAAVSR